VVLDPPTTTEPDVAGRALTVPVGFDASAFAAVIATVPLAVPAPIEKVTVATGPSGMSDWFRP
jgi:hypothetical protein